MRVSCVRTTEEARECGGNIFLFPEGALRSTLLETADAFPHSLVVGAVEEDGLCRAYLLAEGQNQLDYCKIQSDGLGHSEGAGYPPANAIYETKQVCVAAAICMDIDHADFTFELRKRMKASVAAVKLLCVPGDMAQHWFPGDFHQCWEGIHLAMCNNVRTYEGPSRRVSFITDAHCTMAVVQKEYEPVSSELA